jgi:hypothetical protein
MQGRRGVGRTAWGGAVRRAEQAVGVPRRGTGATVESVRKKGRREKKKREKKKKGKGEIKGKTREGKRSRKKWENFGKN